jgi:PD-(D/E)XK endonuclease
MPLYKTSRQLNIGRAGEYLAMFDLLSRGYQAYLTDQGASYDIILDLGSRLLRLQVKTTQKPSKMNKEYANNVYIFNVRRAGRNGQRAYELGEFDGFALVALDRKAVYYYPFTKGITRSLLFRLSTETYKMYAGHTSPYIEQFTLERLLFSLGCEKEEKEAESFLIPENRTKNIQLSFIQSA